MEELQEELVCAKLQVKEKNRRFEETNVKLDQTRTTVELDKLCALERLRAEHQVPIE